MSSALARPGVTLAVTCLLTLAFGAALSGIRFDNTPETWLPIAGSDLADYERFRDRFGEDSLIVAFSRAPDLESETWRRDFAALADELQALADVSWVDAPGRVRPPAEIAPGASGLLASPLAAALQNASGSRAAIAVFPIEGLDAQQRGQLVARIEERVSGWQQRVGPLALAGADVITFDLDRGSQRSLGGLSPLVFLTMCGVFYAATRSALAVGAMLLAVIAASVWTLGLMALFGRTLNLIVVVLPAILAVVTCAQATHLLSRFLSLEGLEAHGADAEDRLVRVRWWSRAIAGCWRPCLLSALTTAAGFASLAVSEITPVRDLGAFTAFGVLASFALSFTLVPGLLATTSRVRPRPSDGRSWTPDRAEASAALLRRHAFSILVGGTLLVAVGSLGLSRLELESHILRFFPPDHRIPTSYADVEEHLLGLTPIELEIEGAREAVLSAGGLAALDRYLEEALEAEPLLQRALSPLANPAGLPAEARARGLDAALPRDSAELPAELQRFVWAAGDRIALRTTLAARTDSSNACDALIQRLRARLAGAFPADVEARITGAATLLIHGQVLLLETQVRSFAVALLVVTLVIVAVFRSLSVVFVSLVPNLMPIVLALGAMGWLEVPLDTATVTVAGIALGLIVDDTIHFLHGFWLARRQGRSIAAAVAETLYCVGRPVFVTSVAVAAGFGAFAFSPFRPTLYFGLLIASTSVAAVLCDLIVLPALIQLRLWRAAREPLASESPGAGESPSPR